MKYRNLYVTLLTFLLTILALGWINISTATAQTRTDPVEVERTTAEACKAKIEAFDDLLNEAVQIKNQKEQCWGANSELRWIMNSMNSELQAAQTQRNALQIQLDQSIETRPRRAVWFAVGASTGVVVTVVTLILISQ